MGFDDYSYISVLVEVVEDGLKHTVTTSSTRRGLMGDGIQNLRLGYRSRWAWRDGCKTDLLARRGG